MSRLNATLLLLLAALIWGLTFVVQKSITRTELAMSALTFTGMRFLIGSLVVLPLMRHERAHAATAVTWRDRRGFILCGVLLLSAAGLQQHGIATTSVANAGFFTGVYVILIPFLLWLLDGRRVHRLVWPAVALTLLGIWLLNGRTLTQLHSGDGWVLLSSLFWAGQIITVGHFAMRSGRPLTLAWTQFATAGVIGTALAQGLTPITLTTLTAAWRELAWAGGMSAGVAFTLQVIAQRHLAPAVAAIIMGAEMVFAALGGAVFLGERLDLWQWLGGGLIFAAIVLAEAIPPPPQP